MRRAGGRGIRGARVARMRRAGGRAIRGAGAVR